MIWLASPGIERRNRGFESALKSLYFEMCSQKIECELLGSREIFSPNKDSKIFLSLASFLKVNLGYKVEMFIFALNLTIRMQTLKPDVIIIMDPAIGKAMKLLLPRSLRRTKVVLWNGGPANPPYSYVDLVAQTNLRILKQNSSIVPPQIYLPHFIPSNMHEKVDKKKARLELNIPEDSIVILCVAAVNESHKKVISLFNELVNCELQQDYFFLLVGNEGQESAEVFKALDHLSHKLRWEHKNLKPEEMYKVYSASDVSILWSLNEGFGICLLESIFYEIPVIVRSESEVVLTFGNLITSVNNTNELKQNLLACLSTKPQELERKAQMAMQEFNPKQVIRTLLSAVNELKTGR